jgi:transposase
MPKPNPILAHESPPASEPRERARGESGAAVESVPKALRRVFTAAEKLRIVRRAEACVASDDRGALEAMMRAEGIYSSLLYRWRAQLTTHGTLGLGVRKTGRKAKMSASEQRSAELAKRNADLERQLHIANVLLDLQKKAHELMGIALPSTNGEV